MNRVFDVLSVFRMLCIGITVVPDNSFFFLWCVPIVPGCLHLILQCPHEAVLQPVDVCLSGPGELHVLVHAITQSWGERLTIQIHDWLLSHVSPQTMLGSTLLW